MIVKVVDGGIVSVLPTHIDNGELYSKVAFSGSVMSTPIHPVFINPFT